MVKKNQIKVELRLAKIPYLGLIAEHFWFVIINNNDHKERWKYGKNPTAVIQVGAIYIKTYCLLIVQLVLV